MQGVLHCSAFSVTAGDVTFAKAGLPQAHTAPALGNFPGKRKGHMFFPLRIWPVNMQCLHSSEKVFCIGILKGRQTCFVLLLETQYTNWGSDLAKPSTRSVAFQPQADPIITSFLQSVDATALRLLTVIQQSSHSQTLQSGWGSKNKCNKCGMGTAAPNWRLFLSYPPKHSWCRDLHLPLCSQWFCFVLALHSQIVCFAVFLKPSALLSLPSL